MIRFLPAFLLFATGIFLMSASRLSAQSTLFAQDFDAIPIGYSGTYGVKTPMEQEPLGGRWKTFGTDSILPEIVAVEGASGHCVRLQRSESDPSQHLVATHLPLEGQKIKWTFKANISEESEALIHFHRSNVSLCGIYFSTKGIRYLNPEPDEAGKVWRTLEARMDPNTWYEFEVILDLDKRTYSGRVSSPQEVILFEDKPLSRALDGPAVCLVISPQRGGAVYIDDLHVVQIDEP
jgi:hypothetical protein